jgi:hypothetical protein
MDLRLTGDFGETRVDVAEVTGAGVANAGAGVATGAEVPEAIEGATAVALEGAGLLSSSFFSSSRYLE